MTQLTFVQIAEELLCDAIALQAVDFSSIAHNSLDATITSGINNGEVSL